MLFRSQSLINPATDVVVWIDDILQVQANTDPLNPMGDYYVNNDTTDRQVIFNINPPDGARILITVNTLADYVVGGNTLVLNSMPNLGDVFAITTWNDTSQQNIETKCFYGPQVTGVTSYEGFDSASFDPDFVATTSVGTMPVTAIAVGESYTILTTGTTNYVAIGAANNNPGTVFTATADGSGLTTTGTANLVGTCVLVNNGTPTAGNMSITMAVGGDSTAVYISKLTNKFVQDFNGGETGGVANTGDVWAETAVVNNIEYASNFFTDTSTFAKSGADVATWVGTEQPGDNGTLELAQIEKYTS